VATAIPIRNVYFLLCYSWNRLKEGELVNLAENTPTELVDLLARVLITGIRHAKRRGLDQAYQLVSEEFPGVRGRVDVVGTARRFLAQHGRARCEFDELTVNTRVNQILKATVQRLLKVSSLDKTLRHALQRIHKDLWRIDDRTLSREAFRGVQLHGNNRHYRFLLNVCELVLQACLVDEETGKYRFRDFLQDERLMAKVFEEFVFNFYRIHRPELEVRKEQISWRATSEQDPQLRLLPRMNTDISLRKPGFTLIVDTKYYKQTLQEHFEHQSVHSAHLYQLYAYLKNIEHRDGSDQCAEGMLLYPVVDQQLRLSYEFPGHRMRVCTVDLMQDWRLIDAELHALLATSMA
jgi:5-methylcytosine-specific restriction enzyme subunit McrC